MASSSQNDNSSSAEGNDNISKKTVPKDLLDLLDVAIYSYSCQSGLRSYHKIRGNPVLEGVSAFFGRLLECSKPETIALFRQTSPRRFGGWNPGCSPSKELLTLVSSRMKTLKAKGDIRENTNPVVPDKLRFKEYIYHEEEDTVTTKLYPICWRCGERCEFCQVKNRSFPNYVDNFKVDNASPFLAALEDTLEDKNDEFQGEDGAEDDGAEDDTEVDGDSELLKQCTSTNDFPESEEEDDDVESTKVTETTM